MSFIPTVIQRIRARFARLGTASRLSHLQQIDELRKALTASPWPLAMTQSKKPKPLISFGPAISVGYESEAEYCDVDLVSRIDLQAAAAQLAPYLPPGFSVLGVKSIPRFFPSLESSVNLAVYQVNSDLLNGRKPAWQAFWEKEHFFVTKKKADREEVIDARCAVRSWTLEGSRLEMELRFGPGRTLKPERVVQAVCGLSDAQIEMGRPECRLTVKRLHLFFEKENGDLVAP